MKYNLKNRPKLRVFLESYSDEAMVDKFDEYHKANVVWFEGFEKELRELCKDDTERIHTWIQVKEILGE